MKGDRPRGKHDTLLARGGDQPAKLSPLDEIVEFPFRQREKQEAKAHQKRLGEIRNIVRRLKRCCRPGEFRWPDKNDLERLDDLVLSLFFEYASDGRCTDGNAMNLSMIIGICGCGKRFRTSLTTRQAMLLGVLLKIMIRG